jgi:radical SAM family uncharacterized protein
MKGRTGLRKEVGDELQRILPQVVKPQRYLGGELNSAEKDWESVQVRYLFAFPDVYEVGMSHLGLQILYGLVNRRPDMLMERAFAPWVDMERFMREARLPLFGLESGRPMKEYDCIGFTLQYELSFTNVLNMLSLGDIPLWAGERDNACPLIIAGGPCASNPEPIAPFIDAFVLGDGEEVQLELLEAVAAHRRVRNGAQDRDSLLKELAGIPGVYVPSFYQPEYEYGALTRVSRIVPEAPARVTRRIVPDLETAFFPVKPLIPYIEVVHDRMVLELFRGCVRGCRFCQAGMIYRPVRERSPETLLGQARDLALNTGHREISLTSLSSSDYSCIPELVHALVGDFEEKHIGVSLSSLRVDAFSVHLAREIQKIRRTGLTFAPEAGTQRLRDIINKGVTEEDITQAADAAVRSGWRQIKLYFMMGLPGETMPDIEGIAQLCEKILSEHPKRGIKITVSVSNFVPKAHTPFQWHGQDTQANLREKQQFLRQKFRGRKIVYHYHDAATSLLEAVFARGDRRLAEVLHEAWRRGCRFDGWTELFNWEAWQGAFEAFGLDPEVLAGARFEEDQCLPWDHLDYGVDKAFLREEYRRAGNGRTTPDCRRGECAGCGLCERLNTSHVLWGAAGS